MKDPTQWQGRVLIPLLLRHYNICLKLQTATVCVSAMPLFFADITILPIEGCQGSDAAGMLCRHPADSHLASSVAGVSVWS